MLLFAAIPNIISAAGTVPLQVAAINSTAAGVKDATS